MIEHLKIAGYQVNEEKQIWSKPDYTGINYSDGDEVESRIGDIIEQASDITSLSTELGRHCTDWPSLYHLSGTRANILRPFAAWLTGDILEIGAGCGAITRYLGECGGKVLALEGSPRRAAIARSRTRDLENVTVLAEKFAELRCDHRFDVITLIGVLEYANLFTLGENPALIMLERVLQLLKPEGKLIIAIENQLGLKYFAGASEDHLGRPMYGVEGRYKKNQPQTFGRAVLTELLRKAGFNSHDFLAPFPDYKLPISIISEEGFNCKDFEASALAWQSVRRDPQLPLYCNFSLELAWPILFQNGLALDMANSFLIVASPDTAAHPLAREILAFQYSTDRQAAYCKETLFQRVSGNGIEVSCKRLASIDAPIDGDVERIIAFTCPASVKYSHGLPLSQELVRIVTADGWTLEQVGTFLRRYLIIVESFIQKSGGHCDTTTPYAKLPGAFFDAIPQNIIIENDGTAVLIDREWAFNDPVGLGYLLFRALFSIISGCTVIGKNSDGICFTRKKFIFAALKATGLSLAEEDYERYIEKEVLMQQQVTGRPAREFVKLLSDHTLPIHNLSQILIVRDAQLAESNQQLAESNQQLAESNQQLALLNQIMSEREATYQNTLNGIWNSTSWRLTRPVRFIGKQLRHLKHIMKSILSSGGNAVRFF